MTAITAFCAGASMTPSGRPIPPSLQEYAWQLLVALGNPDADAAKAVDNLLAAVYIAPARCRAIATALRVAADRLEQ